MKMCLVFIFGFCMCFGISACSKKEPDVYKELFKSERGFKPINTKGENNK